MTTYENDIRSEAVQDFIKTHGLELKKFHALGGPIHESVAFNAELHKDGKKIADVCDDGNGGGTFVDGHSTSAHIIVNEVSAALEEAAIVWFFFSTGDNKPCHWDLESLVTEMAMLLLEEKEWKAKTRTKVFVQTTDCGPDEWYTFKRQSKVSDKATNGRFEILLMNHIVKNYGRENIKEVRGLRTLEWTSFKTAKSA